MKAMFGIFARLRVGGLAVLMVLSCLFCGCEEDGKDPARDYFENNDVDASDPSYQNNPLKMDPEIASLDYNEGQVVITVSGGVAPYRWSVHHRSRGKINGSAGDQVLYTRTAAGNNTVVAFDSAGHSAVCTITQGEENTTPLTVTPASVTLPVNGESVVLTAAGGWPPYTWSLSGSGSLSSTTGVNTLYTRTGIGNATVTCRDNNGESFIVTISNP